MGALIELGPGLLQREFPAWSDLVSGTQLACGILEQQECDSRLSLSS